SAAARALRGPGHHPEEPCVALFKAGEPVHALRHERLVAAERQAQVQEWCRRFESAPPDAASDDLGRKLGPREAHARISHERPGISHASVPESMRAANRNELRTAAD